MRLNSTHYGQSDYEVGDVIVFETATTKQAIEVEQKNADMNPCDEHDNRAGFDGEVVEVIRAESHREVGDSVWGYDNQITEVRG